MIYSSPFFLNEPQQYAGFYHRSVQSKTLPLIVDFLRKTILPTLNDIRLTDERQRFLVDDAHFDESIDLSSYGEGLQRIFFLSLLFASAPNGIVLIDEFENAMHTTMIDQLAPFIYRLVVKFNVQLFLTTHSKECVDAFVKTIDRREDITIHALVDQKDCVVVREYDGNTFYELLLAGNVDVRRAK